MSIVVRILFVAAAVSAGLTIAFVVGWPSSHGSRHRMTLSKSREVDLHDRLRP